MDLTIKSDMYESFQNKSNCNKHTISHLALKLSKINANAARNLKNKIPVGACLWKPFPILQHIFGSQKTPESATTVSKTFVLDMALHARM